VLGVFVNTHALELLGAAGLTDALHECGGLRLFTFGLLAGDLLCHGKSITQS
jgi:hypothetical protein